MTQVLNKEERYSREQGRTL